MRSEKGEAGDPSADEVEVERRDERKSSRRLARRRMGNRAMKEKMIL